MRAHLLYYYIPKVRDNRGRERDVFPNPSNILRRIGYRVDGSVWVIPSDRLPWTLIGDMQGTIGVTCQEVEFSKAEAAKLSKIALETLQKLTTDAVNTVTDKAQTEYDPEQWGSEEDWQKAVAAMTRTAARKATRLLADYRNAAEGFGVSAEDLRLESCQSQIRVLEMISRNKAQIWKAGTAKLRKIDPALARAAEQDELPPAVMADRLRDDGDDERADEIQDTFLTESAA